MVSERVTVLITLWGSARAPRVRSDRSHGLTAQAADIMDAITISVPMESIEKLSDRRKRSIQRVLRAWLRLHAGMRELGRQARRHHGASETTVLLLRVITEAEPVAIGELAELTGHHVASL